MVATCAIGFAALIVLALPDAAGEGIPEVSKAAVAVPEAAREKVGAASAVKRRRAPRCDECGVVESIRVVTAESGSAEPIIAAASRRKATSANSSARLLRSSGDESKLPRHPLEIVVRLQDGTTRTFTDVDSANWKRGERVRLIAGDER
jgi:hypothetical protein